jgi:hypothetical protein
MVRKGLQDRPGGGQQKLQVFHQPVMDAIPYANKDNADHDRWQEGGKQASHRDQAATGSMAHSRRETSTTSSW